jgi:hypothetical protein
MILPTDYTDIPNGRGLTLKLALIGPFSKAEVFVAFAQSVPRGMI